MLYSNKDMDYNILCVGNSRATHSFYTPYLNDAYDANAYNFSYNSLKLGVIKVLLEDYLDRYQNPETVFLEVSEVFSPDSANQFVKYNLYGGYSSRLEDAILQEDPVSHYITEIFPLYRYNTELFQRSLYYLNKSDQSWINRYTISEELNLLELEGEMESFSINASNLETLNEIVSLLKESHIEVQLYIAPYLPNYLSHISNLDDQLELLESKTGLSILDLSGSLIETDNFSDRIHLNEKGTKVVGDLLMKHVNRSDLEFEK